jgi:hypothetical protein
MISDIARQPYRVNSRAGRNTTVRLTMLPLHRLVVVISAIFYAILLVLVLQSTIAVRFAYEGYGFQAIRDGNHAVWTWSLIVFATLLLPIHVHKPSSFFMWLLYLVVYVPVLLIPPYALGYGMEYAPMQGLVFVGFAILASVGLLPPIRFPEPRWMFGAFIAGLLAYSAVIMLWLVMQVGVPTSIPAITSPYAQRAAFSAAMAGAGPVLYLIAWQTSAVNPLILLIGLYRRQWSLFLTGVGLNVLMYSLAGHKSHLLSSLLVVAIYVALRLPATVRGLLIAGGATTLVLVTQALYVVTGAIFPVSILVRRMLMTPGLLTGYYFDFFSDIGFTYRFGPLSMFFDGVDLAQTTPRTIGYEYFGSTTMAANANFWADGYSTMGYIGVVFVSVLLALVLWAMNSLSESRPATIATPLFVIALYSLTNSALPVSLLTHGILLTMLLIWMLPLPPTKSPSPQGLARSKGPSHKGRVANPNRTSRG